MKNLSIRLKITLWFSAALILVAVITFGSVLFVGNQIIQKTIRDNLIETIEYNADEIHFYTSLENVDLQGDLDYFFLYKDGYLQINHDFLSSVNEVYTSLCSANDTLIYGENPLILETADLPFLDRQIQTVRINKTIYYIFDRKLSVDGTDVLWLRGVVSENQGDVQIVSIARTALILLPCITLLAIIGGYVIACRALNPIQHIIDSAGNISQGEDLKKRIEIGQGHDELHQLADCLNEMYERLDNAFQAEKQFTSDASHELRTPITVIMSQCELSLENASTTQEYREALYVIRRQAQKMTRLIRDMLDITRLELRVTQYPLLYYDISEQVQSLCDDMALIRENNIDLNCDIQKNVLYHGTPDLMTRLQTN